MRKVHLLQLKNRRQVIMSKAQGGKTLFLDEIGDMSLLLQSKSFASPSENLIKIEVGSA